MAVENGEAPVTGVCARCVRAQDTPSLACRRTATCVWLRNTIATGCLCAPARNGATTSGRSSRRRAGARRTHSSSAPNAVRWACPGTCPSSARKNASRPRGASIRACTRRRRRRTCSPSAMGAHAALACPILPGQVRSGHTGASLLPTRFVLRTLHQEDREALPQARRTCTACKCGDYTSSAPQCRTCLASRRLPATPEHTA